MTGCRYSLPFIPNTWMNQGRMWLLLALPFMPAAQTGRELSVFCSRCKTRKFPLTCILDLFDHVFRHVKIGFSITYYTCCIEKQLKPSWYLGWYSENHCSLLQVFTCVGTVARISKKTSAFDEAMTCRGARITRNAVIDACEEGKVWQVAIQLLDGADTVACLQWRDRNHLWFMPKVVGQPRKGFTFNLVYLT